MKDYSKSGWNAKDLVPCPDKHAAAHNRLKLPIKIKQSQTGIIKNK